MSQFFNDSATAPVSQVSVLSAAGSSAQEIEDAIIQEVDAFIAANPNNNAGDVQMCGGAAGNTFMLQASVLNVSGSVPLGVVTLRVFVAPTMRDLADQIDDWIATVSGTLIAHDVGASGNGASFAAVVVAALT